MDGSASTSSDLLRNALTPFRLERFLHSVVETVSCIPDNSAHNRWIPSRLPRILFCHAGELSQCASIGDLRQKAIARSSGADSSARTRTSRALTGMPSQRHPSADADARMMHIFLSVHVGHGLVTVVRAVWRFGRTV
jgi:hypothetical protein